MLCSSMRGREAHDIIICNNVPMSLPQPHKDPCGCPIKYVFQEVWASAVKIETFIMGGCCSVSKAKWPCEL